MSAKATLFAVLAQSADSTKLEAAIKQHFASDHYALPRGQWLIVAVGMTTVELSDKLGISNGSNGSALVLLVSSYYGLASPQIWEWLATKQSGGVNG